MFLRDKVGYLVSRDDSAPECHIYFDQLLGRFPFHFEILRSSGGRDRIPKV